MYESALDGIPTLKDVVDEGKKAYQYVKQHVEEFFGIPPYGGI